MIRYLYIPIDKDLDDFMDYAVNNNFNQIIHGESDIVRGYIQDFNSVQEINIPEYKFILNDNLVFKENEYFILTIVDEFSEDSGELPKYIEIYRIDDLDLNKKDFILNKDIIKKQNFIYQVDLSVDKYGEYEVHIKSNNKKSLIKDKIIIYREYKEAESADDKFFFD